MLDKLKHRLVSLGYMPDPDDDTLLIFSMEKTQNTIKNICNINTIPDGLTNIFIDMSVGEFLSSKISLDPQSLSAFDLDVAVKSIQTGDSTVQFDTSTSTEQKIDRFINYLLTYGLSQLFHYRKLRW